MSNSLSFQYQDIAEPFRTGDQQASQEMSWQPSYPAFPARCAPRLLTAAMAFLFYAAGAVVPVEASRMSWSPSYPTIIHAKKRLHVSTQQAVAFTFALPNLPVPSLSWEPEYPSIIWIRRVPMARYPFVAYLLIPHPGEWIPVDPSASVWVGVDPAGGTWIAVDPPPIRGL